MEIFERIGNIREQIQSSDALAWLLLEDEQLDAAEEVASRAIDLIPGEGQEHLASQLHRALGNIYRSKGEKTKAIYHLEKSVGIASSFGWHDALFWGHFGLALLFRDEAEFDEANARIEQAKSHVVNDAFRLGKVMGMQAEVWYRQLRLEEAKSEALGAVEIYEKIGAATAAGDSRELLQEVEQAIQNRSLGF